MSTTVTYKGSTLTTVDNQTRTLKTAGKYMEGDVILVDVTESGSGSGVVWQDGQGYIHLSDEGDIELQTKTVTPTEMAQTITADAGYYALEEVNVGAISSTYVGTGITRRSSSDLTASGATVTVPSGYYSAQASKAVASGTEGTPTATKGTVSNHSISVTPSVTNTTGYITGSTKTGTAVTVSASELVSGSETKTSNGTYDVTNLAELIVNVSGGTSWQTLYDGSVEVYSSSPNYFQISPYTTAFQADQTYRVTWGQTQYLCTTIADPLGATYDGWLIGNLNIVGAGTDTGEPFIIYRNSATGLTGGTSSSAGTHSLKIELQQGGGVNLQTKTKTYTPTTSQQTESVSADNGYDGLDTVSITVNAMPTGTAGTPTATKGTVSNHSMSVTPSVTNTAGYINGGTKTGTAVTVSASELVSGTYSVTSSGTKDVTNYASASVPSGTAGTPTATKGAVSNHSVSVTPSVTNTSGYITGNTKTGTAVTVSASELVSGTKSITENGTGIDVTNYANVDVAVQSGKKYYATITSTGNYNYAYVKHPSSSGTKYYTAGDSFEIQENDEIYLFGNSPRAGVIIYINDEIVVDSAGSSATYTYIVPSATDVEISLTYGNPTKIYLTEIKSELSITQNGSYDVSDYDWANVNVSGGGGGESASKKQINFIDYDGTILHSYTKSEWQSVTALPSNPSHTGLTAQGWNWTKAQIDAQLTAAPNGDVWVGQMYITTSGDTEIDVRFADSTRLSPYLSCAVKGEITIDWGDNSTSTVTGTSLTSRKDTQHVYASVGDYTITIHVESGSWAFYGTSAYALLNKNSSTANANRVYSNCVQNVRIGADTSIGNYAFGYCYSLASVTIPSSVTSIGNYAFYICYSLASVTIPSGITSIGSYTFSSCSSLTSVTIPSGVTNIATNMFYGCYSFASVTIPSGVTSIGTTVFYNCYSLASVTIPSSVASIENSAFTNCYGMAEYHIKPTTPPTLGTTAFSNIQSDCVIYVPSASLTAYQEATNWSTYASYMQGE